MYSCSFYGRQFVLTESSFSFTSTKLVQYFGWRKYDQYLMRIICLWMSPKLMSQPHNCEQKSAVIVKVKQLQLERKDFTGTGFPDGHKNCLRSLKALTESLNKGIAIMQKLAMCLEVIVGSDSQRHVPNNTPKWATKLF